MKSVRPLFGRSDVLVLSHEPGARIVTYYLLWNIGHYLVMVRERTSLTTNPTISGKASDIITTMMYESTRPLSDR